jgi:hypothetical protein
MDSGVDGDDEGQGTSFEVDDEALKDRESV